MASRIPEPRGISQRANVWVIVLVVLFLLLIAYFAFLGFSFMEASSEREDLTRQVERLTRKVQRPLPDSTALSEELESQEREVTELLTWFSYPTALDPLAALTSIPPETRVDLKSFDQEEVHLISVLTSTAQEALVDVTSMTGSNPGQEDTEENETNGAEEESEAEDMFEVKPLNIVIEGQTPYIYSFLSLLNVRPPMASIAFLSIDNVESSPVATIKLRFHHLPEQSTVDNGGAQ